MENLLKRLEYKIFKEYEKRVSNVTDYVWDYKNYQTKGISQLEHNETLNKFVLYYMKEFNLDVVITSGEIQSSVKGKGSETYELSYSSIAPTFLDFNISQGTQTYSSLTLRITSNNQQLRLNGVITACILINDL